MQKPVISLLRVISEEKELDCSIKVAKTEVYDSRLTY